MDSKIQEKSMFCFFAEDEIFQLRESYRGIIEKECEITRKQVEESKQQVVMELELQKQIAEDKVAIFTLSYIYHVSYNYQQSINSFRVYIPYNSNVSNFPSESEVDDDEDDVNIADIKAAQNAENILEFKLKLILQITLSQYLPYLTLTLTHGSQHSQSL